jgi:hypothetical protein
VTRAFSVRQNREARLRVLLVASTRTELRSIADRASILRPSGCENPSLAQSHRDATATLDDTQSVSRSAQLGDRLGATADAYSFVMPRGRKGTGSHGHDGSYVTILAILGVVGILCAMAYILDQRTPLLFGVASAALMALAFLPRWRRRPSG